MACERDIATIAHNQTQPAAAIISVNGITDDRESLRQYPATAVSSDLDSCSFLPLVRTTPSLHPRVECPNDICVEHASIPKRASRINGPDLHDERDNEVQYRAGIETRRRYICILDPQTPLSANDVASSTLVSDLRVRSRILFLFRVTRQRYRYANS